MPDIFELLEQDEEGEGYSLAILPEPLFWGGLDHFIDLPSPDLGAIHL